MIKHKNVHSSVNGFKLKPDWNQALPPPERVTEGSETGPVLLILLRQTPAGSDTNTMKIWYYCILYICESKLHTLYIC